MSSLTLLRETVADGEGVVRLEPNWSRVQQMVRPVPVVTARWAFKVWMRNES